MNEKILKGGQIILTEQTSTWEVVSGTVLVYAALRKGQETGRRYFLTVWKKRFCRICFRIMTV